ncbi:unnamed protein product (macronuclear) [Paramecium tetraurelia]|uniref:Uncharacterized protein n=1 Tax=Paramecium tetraurelia TaxID=5888 RepID=A0CC40_PARTE|nr:uncharacterized protein GSPATT00037141001 [Paramecium tetraurelia]CAK68357.1 unnamed protein product [Paramecium tetraurelia]|eukprot:XP_001435754.1 hypothetical protein (macronuclear) [Paramecium tetraurelia strain d4-2]
MQTKENKQNLRSFFSSTHSTKYLKSDGIRKLTDLTNYDTIKQQQKLQMKHSINNQYQKILGRLPDAKFFNPKSESFVSYPCYNEKYLQFSKEIIMQTKKKSTIYFKFRPKMMIVTLMKTSNNNLQITISQKFQNPYPQQIKNPTIPQIIYE